MEEHREYETFEDMVDGMNAASERAYHWVSPDQWKMCDGIGRHYFVKPVEWRDGMVLAIFGWTWDWEQDKSEWEKLPQGDERMEREGQYDSYVSLLKRGYVFTRSYSVVEVRGILGSHHASTLIPISEEDFNKAKDAGWDPFDLAKVIALGLISYKEWSEEQEVQG